MTHLPFRVPCSGRSFDSSVSGGGTTGSRSWVLSSVGSGIQSELSTPLFRSPFSYPGVALAVSAVGGADAVSASRPIPVAERS